MKDTRIALYIFAVGFALAAGFFLVLRPQPNESADTSPSKAEEPQWQGPSPRQVAERFLAAKTVAERLKWVRHPEQTAPLMEAFYQDGPGSTEEVVKTKPIGTVQTPKLTLQRFKIEMKAAPSRLLAIVVTEQGAEADFKTYARHGTHSWSDLLSGGCRGAEEMRAFVTPGSYYNYHFRDDSKWRSFVARSPDVDDPFFLYVRRGSKEAEQLSNIPRRKPARITVGLMAHEDSFQHRQFEVMQVHSTGWVLPEAE